VNAVSVLWTVLVFVGIPAAVVLVIYGLVYAGGTRPGKRYRPGRPFEFTPVWFLSAPERLPAASGVDGHAALTGARHAELPAGTAGENSSAGGTGAAAQGDLGGASDRW
jgi:hypothetical protein